MWGGKVTAGDPQFPQGGGHCKAARAGCAWGGGVVSHGSPVPPLPAPKSAVPGKPRCFWGYWEGWWPRGLGL